MAMTESEKMIWDLSQLVEFDDPGYIEEQLSAYVKAAEEFGEKHRGKIASYNSQQVLDMIKETDEIHLQYDGALFYSLRMYDANMNDETAKRLADKARNAYSALQQAFAFVALEAGELISKNPEIINDPVLAEFKHYLESIQRRIPYMLSEEAEKIIITKDRNGVRAWSQLQGDWLATRTYQIELDGKVQTLPYGEIIQHYQHKDREVRRRVHEVVYRDLGKDHILWASALRAVCSDHLQMVKLRGWESPMTQSFLANDVDEETITALMNTIEKNRGVYQDYLLLKASTFLGGRYQTSDSDREAVYTLFRQSLALDPYCFQTCYYIQGYLPWEGKMPARATQTTETTSRPAAVKKI